MYTPVSIGAWIANGTGATAVTVGSGRAERHPTGERRTSQTRKPSVGGVREVTSVVRE